MVCGGIVKTDLHSESWAEVCGLPLMEVQGREGEVASSAAQPVEGNRYQMPPCGMLLVASFPCRRSRTQTFVCHKTTFYKLLILQTLHTAGKIANQLISNPLNFRVTNM